MPIISNGQWVPEDHPLYIEDQKKTAATQPGPSTTGTTTTGPNGEINVQVADDFGQGEQPTPYGDDTRTGTETNAQAPAPSASNPWVAETMGGMAGYRNPTTGQWVPGDHPLATSAGNPSVNPNGGQPTGGAPAAPGAGAGGSGAYTPPNLAPGTPGTTPLNTQASNAQTYSQTPGADPDAATTNQGTQDVWRNKLLEMATQDVNVDTNDPAFRNQADAFRAASSRAARELQADQAVASGPTGQAFTRGQQRLTAANAQQQQGSFEAQLVGRELANKRDEIKMALSSLGAGIENDQRRALELKLGELNAAMQKLGIETGAATAAQELALKDKLGMGGLNVDLMRALLQNRQFGDELGFNIADREAFYNNQTMQNLLG